MHCHRNCTEIPKFESLAQPQQKALRLRPLAGIGAFPQVDEASQAVHVDGPVHGPKSCANSQPGQALEWALPPIGRKARFALETIARMNDDDIAGSAAGAGEHRGQPFLARNGTQIGCDA